MEETLHNQNKTSKRNFLYKIKENSKTVSKCLTHSQRVFSQEIRTINWEDLIKNHQSVYLRVTYPKDFKNEGVYQDRNSFYLALNAFLEE